MSRINRFAAAAVLGLGLGGMMVPPVQAAMVSEAVTLSPAISNATINSALNTTSIQAALQRHGVDPELARARVNALSDAELNALASRYEELPAGGAVAEAMIIGFLIWAVLNATDYGGIFMGDDENKAATQ